MGKTILCADNESIAMPALMGIAETDLDSIDWLECSSDACEIRRMCRTGRFSEAWILGTDNFTSLNLAAALLHDNADIVITIVESNPTGSFMSRAAQAKVTRVISADEFCALFYTEVRRRSLMKEVASIDIGASMPVEVGEDAETGAAGSAESVEGVASPASVESVESVRSVESAPSAPSITSPKAAEISDIPRGDAFVMSVFGGSGGVGKSSFCALASYAIASKGFRTAVVDFDLQFGDLSVLCAESLVVPIEKVVEDSGYLDEVASKKPSGKRENVPVIISAPANIEDSEKIAPQIPQILSGCSNAFDVVIVNTQSHWNESAVSILERSTCPIFMMDQRSSSVRACMRIADLCMRMGVATGAFVYALNGCSKGSMFNPLDVANAMQGVQVFELSDGANEVEEILGAGGARDLFESDNPFARSVKNLITEVLPNRSACGDARSDKDAARSKSADKNTPKPTVLERRMQKSKRKREKKQSEANDESLITALFGNSGRAESFLADEMRAPK